MTPSQRDMLGREGLTSVSNARTLLLSTIEDIYPETEIIEIGAALDRVTAVNINAPEDLPPQDRSTMDGFAVIAADTYGASDSMPSYLDITGEVEMGALPAGKISRGTCYRIPTGGLLPDGADAVVMFEHTVTVDRNTVEIVKGVGSGGNVIRKGDDIKQEELAVRKGTRLRPSDLGLLAGLGISSVQVYKKPKVGVISTGDEIVAHTEPAISGKIRNINSVTLAALARQCGAEVVDYGIVPDIEEVFFAALDKVMKETDVVIFSGGSSVGMRDLGEQTIKKLGQPGVLVHGVALKPGKPIIIGCCNKTPVFGLPGHPVSAMVCFDLFIRPTLIFLAGDKGMSQFPRPSLKARLTRNMNSAAGRLDVIRVQLETQGEEILAHPVLGRSGAISTMSKAHGYFFIDEDCQGLNTEAPVEVYLYQ